MRTGRQYRGVVLAKVMQLQIIINFNSLKVKVEVKAKIKEVKFKNSDSCECETRAQLKPSIRISNTRRVTTVRSSQKSSSGQTAKYKN